MNWHEIIESTIVSSQFFKVCEEIFDDLDKPSKRTRNRNEKYINYSNTNWGKFIRDPLIKVPTSSKGLLFRRRFRVPFALFEYILQLCEDSNVFEVKCKQHILIPIEIKLLICLRIMERGEALDSIAEFFEVSEPYCSTIFHKFIKNFRNNYEGQFIKLSKGNDLAKIMKEYALLGLPGTIGSVDVTHVQLDKCNAFFPGRRPTCRMDT